MGISFQKEGDSMQKKAKNFAKLKFTIMIVGQKFRSRRDRLRKVDSMTQDELKKGKVGDKILKLRYVVQTKESRRMKLM